MDAKPTRDRITLELTKEDRTLLELQRKMTGFGPREVNDAKLILGVYRRFAGQVIKPAGR